MIAFFRRQSSHFTPLGRETLRAHLVLSLTIAPFIAMIQYASFIMEKTYGLPGWVPVLSSTVLVCHLLGVVVSNRVQRSSKVAWSVWPQAIGCVLMLTMVPMATRAGHLFGLTMVVIQLSQSPVVTAQTALFRANYPVAIRSRLMAMALVIYMISMALFSTAIGQLLERSEQWIGAAYAVTGVIGLLGVWNFSRLRRLERPSEKSGESRGELKGFALGHQFGLLLRDRSFRLYEIAYFFFGGASIGMITTLPIYLNREFNAGHEQAMYVINVIPMLGAVLMLPVWGSLLDRHNPLVMRAGLNLVTMVVPFILLISPSIGWVYLAALLGGLFKGGGFLIWHLGVNYFARSQNVSHYMGLHQTLTGGRGILMPFLAYWGLNLIGPRPIMAAWMVMMFVGALVALAAVRNERRQGSLGNFTEKEARNEGMDG